MHFTGRPKKITGEFPRGRARDSSCEKDSYGNPRGLVQDCVRQEGNQPRAETKLKGFLTEGMWCLLLILDDRKEAESKMFDWFRFQGVPYHFVFFSSKSDPQPSTEHQCESSIGQGQHVS